MQAVAGTYTPATLTTTDDTLTVTDEFVAATHIFGFEEITSNFDLFFTANKAITSSLTQALDKWVVNELCEGGTGTYTTPVGGFTTAANVLTIISNIISKCSGYADSMNGMYVIVEAADLTGIIQAQGTNGFSYADAALNNGLLTKINGVEIYVVQTGTFVDATTTSASGSKTWTNSGHRVGGIKNITTYAAPRGLKFEEKGVTGKTGMEVVGYCLAGFKVWTPTATLTIDITLA